MVDLLQPSLFEPPPPRGELAALAAIGRRLDRCALLYVDADHVADLRPDLRALTALLPHGPRSRAMVRVTADATAKYGQRKDIKRFVPPDSANQKSRPFLLDHTLRARRESLHNAVPRNLADMVGAHTAPGCARLWLRSMADVLWVCSFPWSVDWFQSLLFQAMVRCDRSYLMVTLDHMQDRGDPIGEALAVWYAARDAGTQPSLAQAHDVFRSTRTIRDQFDALCESKDDDKRGHDLRVREFWRRRRDHETAARITVYDLPPPFDEERPPPFDEERPVHIESMTTQTLRAELQAIGSVGSDHAVAR